MRTTKNRTVIMDSKDGHGGGDVKKSVFRKGFKNHVKAYCEVSSIQGLNYMTKNISCFERIWWILVFISCVGGCSFMIYQLIEKWISTPVLVSLATSETSINRIPFPAVTICPETKISRRCLNYTETLIRRRAGKVLDIAIIENIHFDYMSLLCRSDNHESTLDLLQRAFLDQFNKSTPELGQEIYKKAFQLEDYSKFLQDCKSVELEKSLCRWMGWNVNCEDILTPILTDEGLCYSFNMFDVRDIYTEINRMEYFEESRRNPDWDPDAGYTDPANKRNEDLYPRRALMNGAKNSLDVVLFTKKTDLYYSCRDFALQGIRVSLHMPSRVPRPSQVFFSVGLNRLTTVAVVPSFMSTTETVKQYDPFDRNCYFGNERKLKYFRVYSQANCNMECWTNYTVQYCGCAHFYMPRDANTSICNLEKRFCLENARVEYPISVLSERLENRDKKSSSHCNCLPICSDLHYNAEISSGRWEYHEDEPTSDFSNEYFASAVKIFFKNTYFLPTERSELYGIVDFISNAGGILGLFTGFSLFSLAEIVYFLSIRLIENRRRYGHWAELVTLGALVFEGKIIERWNSPVEPMSTEVE